MLDNFECLVLLSSSEKRQEVCKLMFSIGQGIDWYKVLVVGKNSKLNETIEVSALWSNTYNDQSLAYSPLNQSPRSIQARHADSTQLSHRLIL